VACKRGGISLGPKFKKKKKIFSVFPSFGLSIENDGKIERQLKREEGKKIELKAPPTSDKNH
jgi:hypothetical protein